MEVERGAASPADVRRVFRTLWRRKYWVVFSVGIAVFVALVSASRQTKLYQASSSVRFDDPADSSLFGLGAVKVQTPEQEAATEQQTANAPEVRQKVAEQIGLAQFRHLRALSAVPQSSGATVLVLKATSDNPAVARNAANAFATAYKDYRSKRLDDAMLGKVNELRRFADGTASQIADMDKQIAALDNQIAGLSADIAAAGGNTNPGAAPEKRAQQSTLGTQRTQLAGQRDELNRSQQEARTRADQLSIEAGLTSATGTQIISAAGLPGAPVSPTPTRDAEVAAMLGLLVGLGLAFTREFFDDRLHGLADLTDGIGEHHILATTLPLKGRRPQDRIVALHAPDSAEGEAYRALRTSLEFVNLDAPLRTVMVTSAVEAEGKSTTVANLAVSLASTGARVAVLDFDLRRPSLAQVFEVDPSRGLTSVLLGDIPVEEALVRLPLPSAGELFLLPTGPLPPHPGEVVSSHIVGKMIADLREHFDIIVIDSPPVLPVSDVLGASRWVDGVVIVARAGVSRLRQLKSAIRRLEQTDTPIMGVVLNGVPGGDASYYYRGSSYYRSTRDKSSSSPGTDDWNRLLVTEPRPLFTPGDGDRPGGGNGGSRNGGAGASNGGSRVPRAQGFGER